MEPSVSSLPGTPRSVSFRDATVQGTPKQLHFVEAKSELKKSSQPVLPKGQRSILKSSTSPKSVKDRSPTPERWVVILMFTFGVTIYSHYWGCRDCGCMVVRFTTTYVISASHH